MRNYLLDILGLIGFGLLIYGLYLRFGLPDALICAGGLLLVVALLGARAAKRNPSKHQPATRPGCRKERT